MLFYRFYGYRLLEQQLQKTEHELKTKTVEYEAELKDLRKENDKQQKLINHVSTRRINRSLSLYRVRGFRNCG